MDPPLAEAAFDAVLGLAAAGGFLEAALAFFAGLSSFPATHASDLAGGFAFAFFLRSFYVFIGLLAMSKSKPF
jgi:hypothetical protein